MNVVSSCYTAIENEHNPIQTVLHLHWSAPFFLSWCLTPLCYDPSAFCTLIDRCHTLLIAHIVTLPLVHSPQHISMLKSFLLKRTPSGHLGGSVGWASDFGSGHDLTIPEFSPSSGSVLTAQILEPASDSVPLSLPLSLPLPHTCSVSLCLSKIKKTN